MIEAYERFVSVRDNCAGGCNPQSKIYNLKFYVGS
jgi:hypothetical protein